MERAGVDDFRSSEQNETPESTGEISAHFYDVLQYDPKAEVTLFHGDFSFNARHGVFMGRGNRNPDVQIQYRLNGDSQLHTLNTSSHKVIRRGQAAQIELYFTFDDGVTETVEFCYQRESWNLIHQEPTPKEAPLVDPGPTNWAPIPKEISPVDPTEIQASLHRMRQAVASNQMSFKGLNQGLSIDLNPENGAFTVQQDRTLLPANVLIKLQVDKGELLNMPRFRGSKVKKGFRLSIHYREYQEDLVLQWSAQNQSWKTKKVVEVIEEPQPAAPTATPVTPPVARQPIAPAPVATSVAKPIPTVIETNDCDIPYCDLDSFNRALSDPYFTPARGTPVIVGQPENADDTPVWDALFQDGDIHHINGEAFAGSDPVYLIAGQNNFNIWHHLGEIIFGTFYPLHRLTATPVSPDSEAFFIVDRGANHDDPRLIAKLDMQADDDQALQMIAKDELSLGQVLEFDGHRFEVSHLEGRLRSIATVPSAQPPIARPTHKQALELVRDILSGSTTLSGAPVVGKASSEVQRQMGSILLESMKGQITVVTRNKKPTAAIVDLRDLVQVLLLSGRLTLDDKATALPADLIPASAASLAGQEQNPEDSDSENEDLSDTADTDPSLGAKPDLPSAPSDVQTDNITLPVPVSIDTQAYFFETLAGTRPLPRGIKVEKNTTGQFVKNFKSNRQKANLPESIHTVIYKNDHPIMTIVSNTAVVNFLTWLRWIKTGQLSATETHFLFQQGESVLKIQRDSAAANIMTLLRNEPEPSHEDATSTNLSQKFSQYRNRIPDENLVVTIKLQRQTAGGVLSARAHAQYLILQQALENGELQIGTTATTSESPVQISKPAKPQAPAQASSEPIAPPAQITEPSPTATAAEPNRPKRPTKPEAKAKAPASSPNSTRGTRPAPKAPPAKKPTTRKSASPTRPDSTRTTRRTKNNRSGLERLPIPTSRTAQPDRRTPNPRARPQTRLSWGEKGLVVEAAKPAPKAPKADKPSKLKTILISLLSNGQELPPLQGEHDREMWTAMTHVKDQLKVYRPQSVSYRTWLNIISNCAHKWCRAHGIRLFRYSRFSNQDWESLAHELNTRAEALLEVGISERALADEFIRYQL